MGGAQAVVSRPKAPAAGVGEPSAAPGTAAASRNPIETANFGLAARAAASTQLAAQAGGSQFDAAFGAFKTAPAGEGRTSPAAPGSLTEYITAHEKSIERRSACDLLKSRERDRLPQDPGALPMHGGEERYILAQATGDTQFARLTRNLLASPAWAALSSAECQNVARFYSLLTPEMTRAEWGGSPSFILRSMSEHIRLRAAIGLSRDERFARTIEMENCAQHDPERRRMQQAIFDGLSPHGKEVYLRFLESQAEKAPLCLDDRDKDGRTLIENLYRLATAAEAAPKLGIEIKPAMLDGAVETALFPGLIQQGTKGTCGASAVLWDVAARHPAEIARMTADLFIKGESDLKGSPTARRSDNLCVVKDAIVADGSGRNVVQRLLQAGFMDIANGPGRTYSNVSDAHSWNLSALPGALFEPAGSHASRGQTMMEKAHLAAEVTGKFHLDLGKQAWQLAKEPLASGKMPSCLASLSWNGRGHAIVVTGIEDGRVYFKNSQGNTEPPGTELQNPPRRVEDPEFGIESMTLNDFEGCVTGAVLPFATP